MRILKIILLVVSVVIVGYFIGKTLRSTSVVGEPTELKTTHFVITYKGTYEEEARAVADSLEGNYERIRTNLNDPDHEIINVFIHATQADFNNGTGLINSGANGTSRGPNEFHFIWTNWFNSVFPNDPVKTAIHEFTHCVQLNILIKEAQRELPPEEIQNFDEVFETKFISEYPPWFWEAICDYEAGMVNKLSVKYAMRKKPTLRSLNNSNQIYNVGYTIIEYIVEEWGEDKLPQLIRSYVDFESVLNVSESEFENGWIDFVNKKY